MPRSSNDRIIEILQKTYPRAKIALHFKNPLQLLVATILSAQCTDKRVNIVTADLFKKYKTAKAYANVNPAKLEQDIRSTGFYHAKAKSIIGAAKLVLEKFGGKVPSIMEELLTLPGVARKTATVVLFNAYGKIEGITVDTHVRRVSQRLGLTKNDEPVKIEQDLMKLVPSKLWGKISYLLIEHGRAVCTARAPKCSLCPLNEICPSAFKVKKWV